VPCRKPRTNQEPGPAVSRAAGSCVVQDQEKPKKRKEKKRGGRETLISWLLMTNPTTYLSLFTDLL